MPSITAAIDPITRIEGHLRMDVDIDTVQGVQQIVDARAVGTLFRGFEKILEGRDPRDATIITSRICGVCPTAHALAAALALDDAIGVTPPETGRILRNLVHGACFIESDILHFYLLSLPDYIRGPGMAPWTPDWSVGRRLDRASADRLQANYLQAVTFRRKAHEMGAIFGGKLPHTPAFIAGGFTAVADTARFGDVDGFQALLAELVSFIAGTYIPDVELLASLYDDYFSIGRGHGNLLSFGSFRLNASGSSKLFSEGRVVAGSDAVEPLNPAVISEHVSHSWYDDATTQLHPASGDTVPQHPKLNGYSWLKAPRYHGDPYECGPLSRMAVNGEYSNGVSVMDRHLARAREALKIAQAMQAWAAALTNTTGYAHAEVPETGTGVGLTEAPRGALGHWLEIRDRKIDHYQVITPTCWNVSPRDDDDVRGSLEEALVGTPVANADQPVEALRVIHSFDPCLDCATHVSVAGRVRQVFPPRSAGGA